MHVLVVDDSKAIQDSLCKLLSSLGYSVETACNGLDAFEKAQKNKHDLYIVDHLMPLMNGVLLSKNLSNNEHCKDTPILFMSTKDLEEVKQLPERSLFSQILAKPIQEKELLSALEIIEESNKDGNTLSLVL
jgi:two-component system chemotaxis response regulator CheY